MGIITNFLKLAADLPIRNIMHFTCSACITYRIRESIEVQSSSGISICVFADQHQTGKRKNSVFLFYYLAYRYTNFCAKYFDIFGVYAG